MKKNGFTLVELLATITILGILMVVAIPNVSKVISQSRQTNIESQKKALEMAAKSYTQVEKEKLPKAIGASTYITANDLKAANYLKDDIQNGSKQSCMENSKVKITKTSESKYEYKAYVYCGTETVPAELTPDSPIIEIEKIGNNIKINIKGNNANTINLSAYSYNIAVGYGTSSLVSTYNSGSISVIGKNTSVTKSIEEFIDPRTTTKIQVFVEAYNVDGGYQKLESSIFQIP